MNHEAFEYQLKVQTEHLGGRDLRIECLASLDRTIDDLFAFLQKEGREGDLERLCPYFGVVWPSARALTEHLAEAIPAATGARVLEIGCGLAVPSVFLALKGAQVIATDCHPAVPEFLARNLSLNGLVAGDVRYLELDWQQLSHGAGASSGLGRFPWVVGSDILYESKQPVLVADTIERFLAPGGRAIIADPARPYIQPFADEMERRGYRQRLTVKRVRDSESVVPASPSGLKDVFVLEFQR